MKNQYLLLIICFHWLSSCKPIQFTGSFSQLNQTQVVLSGANFKVLGSFKGIATMSKAQFSIKNMEGLVSEAKSNLLEKAKQEGAELKGPRAMVNVTVDMIQNVKRITVTVSADIIEYTK